ncbi:thioredoxin-like protein [Naematelia encephala]|uniref:Thioredoxin-like protein n=1 Tax=Naematelia encephala TaxID=71784 RepID=A0A1Y2AJB8_9TREE|nr:thioredoxin-like protein [Naematelia encephala]
MVNPNEDTEFNDALRARGILPPKPPSRSPSPDIPHITHSDAIRAVAQTADASQLSTLLEADNIDSDDERMFETYRRQRMAEMRKEEKLGRFGSVLPLGREDFVREVTEGSKEKVEGELEDDEEEEDEDDEGIPQKPRRLRGTGVVVFLYKDSVPLAQHLRPLLSQLAAAHPATKFMAIRSDLCIPNYPDRNVPTLLVYRNGDMVGNIVAGAGLNGMKTTVQDLESLLIRFQALIKPSPAIRARRRDDEDGELDDDLDDEVGTVNARRGGVRNGGGIGTGGKQKDDSDESDFDM